MKNTMEMNNKLNTEELTTVAGGTGPLPQEEKPVGWPNEWDVAETGPLESCDPPFQIGPLGSCDPPFQTGPLNNKG